MILKDRVLMLSLQSRVAPSSYYHFDKKLNNSSQLTDDLLAGPYTTLGRSTTSLECQLSAATWRVTDLCCFRHLIPLKKILNFLLLYIVYITFVFWTRIVHLYFEFVFYVRVLRFSITFVPLNPFAVVFRICLVYSLFWICPLRFCICILHLHFEHLVYILILDLYFIFGIRHLKIVFQTSLLHLHLECISTPILKIYLLSFCILDLPSTFLFLKHVSYTTFQACPFSFIYLFITTTAPLYGISDWQQGALTHSY